MSGSHDSGYVRIRPGNPKQDNTIRRTRRSDGGGQAWPLKSGFDIQPLEVSDDSLLWIRLFEM